MDDKSEYDSQDWHDWVRWEAEGRRGYSKTTYPAGTDAAAFYRVGEDHAKQSGKERDRLVRNVMAAADRAYRKRMRDAMKANARKYAKATT